MRATTTLLAIVCVFLFASVSLGDKAEALAKIDSLIESGHLDEAKRLIDHLMAHNAGDPDLKRLNEKWKVRKGNLGLLSTATDLEKPENRKLLREACFLVVRATMGGNPEEWTPLMDCGDDEEAQKLLTERTSLGSAEERRVAKALLHPLPIEEPTAEDLVQDVKRGPESCRAALLTGAKWKERALRPFARKIFDAETTTDLRIAAAGYLLALGEGKKRAFLVKSLETDRPADAVSAARLLARYSGGSLTKLFGEVEENDRILRARSQILAEFIAGCGAWRDAEGKPDAGAREFLIGLLASPRHHVDAARALGALHDPATVPTLLEYLRAPRPVDDDEDATAGGLGYLGRGDDDHHSEVHEAEEMRPVLVAAIALLRATAP